jgi:hypothetical protein
MNKIYIGTMLFLSAFSYSQKKIEKGSYVSTTQGQDIRLNLKENNQYELVVFYGDYEIKNDTLQLGNNHVQGDEFAVAFSSEANPSLGKVKVKLIGNAAYYYGIYIGTQSGSAEPSFKTISELAGETEFDKTEATFEINRSDYFYLVKEDYNGESTLNKYAMPRSSNEIQIQYNPNYLGNIQLQGFLNEKEELVVSEKSKRNPIIFVEESKKPKALESQVKPVETTKKKNWTYAGKDTPYGDYYGVVADSTMTPATNFKLAIQDNLQKAIDATKKNPQKFLVISYDPDNKDSKTAFDEFIKNQEYSIGTYASYEYGEMRKEYDNYNYYQASAKDKSWASKNKIKNNPSTIILDSEGNIVSQTKGTVAENAYFFDVYSSSILENLRTVKAMSDLKKSLNSKAKEAVILKKLVPLSKDNAGSWSIYPPISAQAVEVPVSVNEVMTETAVDTAMAYSDYYSQNEPVYVKIDFEKKKLLDAWESVVKAHAKDSKPDMDFVAVAQAEIQNFGFYRRIFNEERLYDETNFKAIDYLLKHYDAIAKEQRTEKVDSMAMDFGSYDGLTIETILPNAILNHSNLITSETPVEYEKRLLEIYRKILEKQGASSRLTMQYLTALEGFARKTNSEKEYISEYDKFFDKTFKEANEIVVLDEMFSTVGNTDYFGDWQAFKIAYASASNQAAWFVVEKSNNPESIKKAIKWSESSLRIEKNSPYYLDTLAQLYYKYGEKQKAISTQEQAVKNATEIDETTKQEMEIVLEKMKNGTY